MLSSGRGINDGDQLPVDYDEQAVLPRYEVATYPCMYVIQECAAFNCCT